MATKITSGQTVLFIGDSITDCGRRGGAAPLGSGYVRFFSDLMTIREPQKQFEIINKGIGGDNVVGLRNRWSDDVLRHKPDFLSIKIGINDLHSGLRDPENGVTPDVYEDAYEDILSRTKKKLPKCRILLIDPFLISIDTAPSSFRATVLKKLPEYIDIVHRLSRKHKTRLVKTHEMFVKLLKYYDSDRFCPEPVHPHQTGHLAIAEEVYKAFGK